MRAKQNWIMPLLAAVVVACVGWWADQQLREVMQEELTEDLRTMLDADVTALEIWMANQKRIAAVLAEDPRLRNLAVELLNKGGAKGTDQTALAGLARQLIIGDRLQARLSSLGYTVAQLVNTNLRGGAGFRARAQPHGHARWRKTCSHRYAELFASGEPIIITPFKMPAPEAPGWPQGGRGPGGRAGSGRPGPGQRRRRRGNQCRRRSTRTDRNAGGGAAEGHQRRDARRAGAGHQPGRGIHAHPVGRPLGPKRGNLRV